MSSRTVLFALLATAFLAGVAAARADDAHQTSITIRDHKFEPAELKVPANKPIVLKVINSDPTSEEFESKQFKAEKVIAGKSEGTVRISPLKPGRYKFYGEYHEATAQGVLVAE